MLRDKFGFICTTKTIVNLKLYQTIFLIAISSISIYYAIIIALDDVSNTKYVFTVNSKSIEYIEQFAAIKSKAFLLRNILNDDDSILKDERHEKIFFLETHQNSDRKFESARQACSVESAARLNAEMEVYLVFVTNSSGINMHYSDMIEALLSYPNVQLRFLNPIEFSKGTALEDFFKHEEIKKSHYPIVHLSDILRVMMLNKFGGQYFDLDIISLVPLSNITHVNFACAESEKLLSNAIMNFDTQRGRDLTSFYIKKLSEHFDFNGLITNGPALLTNVVKNFCPSTNFSSSNYTKCDDFTFAPTFKCFPLSYPEWKKLYEENYAYDVLKRLRERQPHFIHFWNKMQEFKNKTYELPFTSKCAYVLLARKYCPRVYDKLEKFF